MMGSVLALVLLILFSAFFSSVETAYNSLNRMRLEKKAERGSRTARTALGIQDNYSRALPTLLVGNTLVNTAASSISTVLFVSLLGDEAVGGVVATAVITLILLIFGEIIPKVVGKRMSLKLSCTAAYPLRILMILFAPVTLIVGGFVRLCALLWKKKDAQDAPTVTEDEIANIIETVEEEGVIDEDQSELLQSSLDFSDITVEEVMTPRVDVKAIDIEEETKTAYELMTSTNFSRFPVYRDSVDHITGILYLSSFLKAVASEGIDNVKIADHVMETEYVHKTTKLPDALDKMRERKLHMIVVLDEYGGTLGIVTMEDILEEIVGDIWDETDVIETEIVKTGNNTYEVLGQTNLEDFFDDVGVDAHDLDSEYTTVGGWAVEMLNEDVHVGDSFTYKNLYVEVAEMANRIVEKLFVLVREPDDEKEEEKD